MAANFALTRRAAPESGRVDLSVLDVELCNLVGEAVHSVRYCLGWFDMVGFWLAQGWTWLQVRVLLQKYRADGRGPDGAHRSPLDDSRDAHHDYFNALARIVDYLEANFEVDHWSSWGQGR